jgi:two-component sensor histidine kinase
VHNAINEASQRVSVMARIYERLYSDANFREVALRPLAEQVVQDALELSPLSEEMISLSVEELTVPTRESLSIGIILNELITNAVKYAFSSDANPRIEVNIIRNHDFQSLDIRVADNGRGFPQDVISGERRGYGLTIVKEMTGQHDGILELRNDGGGIILARLKSV